MDQPLTVIDHGAAARRPEPVRATPTAAPLATEAVLRNHLQAARVGPDAVLQDYADDSVLITHGATYRGRAQIRAFFVELLGGLPPEFFAAFTIKRQEVAGDVAYILWEAKPWLAEATDTFVVRGGKIRVQTYTARPANS